MKIVQEDLESSVILKENDDKDNNVLGVGKAQPALLDQVEPVVYCSWNVHFRVDGTALAVREDSMERVVLRPIVEEEATAASFDDEEPTRAPRVSRSSFPSVGNVHADHEGWLFGDAFDPNERRVAITGVCLFDARWAVRFTNKGKKKYTFWNNNSRTRVFELVEQGYSIKDMYVPKGLGQYHLDLIQWIGEKLSGEFRQSTDKVLIHIPQHEYHHYLREFEDHCGIQFPSVHDLIDQMADEVKTKLLNVIPDCIEVQFIDPYLMTGDPEASFLLPYEKPELFGVESGSLFGLEEFGEAKIPLIIQEKYDRKIPTFCATVGFPRCHYVYVKINHMNSIKIEISKYDDR